MARRKRRRARRAAGWPFSLVEYHPDVAGGVYSDRLGRQMLLNDLEVCNTKASGWVMTAFIGRLRHAMASAERG